MLRAYKMRNFTPAPHPAVPAPLYPLLSVQSAVPAPNFAMPVTVPVTNQNTLQFSNPGSSLVTQSLVTSSLTDPRLLSPQQPALQRNTVSPGLPQRPASAGERCHVPSHPHLLTVPARGSPGMRHRARDIPGSRGHPRCPPPLPGGRTCPCIRGWQEQPGTVVAHGCLLLPSCQRLMPPVCALAPH